MSEQDYTIKQAVSEAIGGCAGYVSMCWWPKPTGVFDSTRADAAVEFAVARAHSAMQEERAAGYMAGVQAAREAVDAAYDDERYAHRDNWGVSVVYKDLMLAAIDALRGER